MLKQLSENSRSGAQHSSKKEPLGQSAIGGNLAIVKTVSPSPPRGPRPPQNDDINRASDPRSPPIFNFEFLIFN
jgi:hypothetical protein